MKKSQEFELRKKCNNLDAFCGFKDYLYNDGPNRGLRAREGSEGTFKGAVVFIVSLRRNIKIARLRLNRCRVIMTQHFLQ